MSARSKRWSVSSGVAITFSVISRQDDFGEPENAFIICTFWYIDA